MMIQPYLGYAFIILVCAIVGLVAFGKVNQKCYPFILYGIAVGMVLQTSLAGAYLVGSDIHLEYYYAQLYSGKDVWLPMWSVTQETALVNTYMATVAHKVFHIPLIWLYKIVYPSIFASVPVIMYFVFTKWVSRQNAFLASMFFIAFPVFYLEMPTIARQMIGESFLALFLFLVIKSNLRLKYKLPLVMVVGMLVVLAHYATGLVFLMFFGAWLVFKLVLKVRTGMPVWAFGIILILLLAGGTIYFANSAQGCFFWKTGSLYNKFVPDVVNVNVTFPPPLEGAPQPTLLTTYQPIPAEPKPVEIKPVKPKPDVPFWVKYEQLMDTGLGIDFSKASLLGKLFRIMQWVFVLLIPIGLWKMRGNKEYLMFASGAVFVLALCLIPGFSSTMNISRFLHIALLLLTPALVVGGLWIYRKPQVLVLAFLIPYFLFSSGFVFEILQKDDVSKLDIPYSIAMSDHRIDLSATFTANDVEVRDWIASSQLPFPLYSDFFAAVFVAEKIGQRPGINHKFTKSPSEMVAPPYYVFLRERNIQDNSVAIWTGVGGRRYSPLADYGVDPNKNIIYQVGEARVIRIDGGDGK